jgi:predicted membrane protein
MDTNPSKLRTLTPVLLKESILTMRNGGSCPLSRRHAAVGSETKESVVPVVVEEEKQWLKPALHNTPAFRAVSLVSALGLAWYYSANAANPFAALSSKAAATLHLLAYGTWLGSVFYTTFIAGITMFKNLPRQTFGKVQSKLFPIYFNLGAITISLQLLTLAKLPALMTKNVLRTLGTSFAMTLLNMVYLEPLTTRNMFQRYDLDNMPGGNTSEKYRQLAKSFGMLHGISSLANLIAFCGAVVHGVNLASVLIA